MTTHPFVDAAVAGGSRVQKWTRHVWSAVVGGADGCVVWVGYDTDLRSYFVSVFVADDAGRDVPQWDVGLSGVQELPGADDVRAVFRRRGDVCVDAVELDLVLEELTAAVVVASSAVDAGPVVGRKRRGLLRR